MTALMAVGAVAVPTVVSAAAGPQCASVGQGGDRFCVTVTRMPVREVMSTFRTAARTASLAQAAVAGWEPDPDPGSIPAFCNTTDTRVTSCAAQQLAGAIVDTKGVVKGTATVQVIYWQALSNKALTWTMGGKLYVVTATGSALVGSSINGTAVCNAGCTVAGNASTKVPLVIGTFMRGQWQITSTAPGATPVTSTQQLRLRFESPAPTVPGVGNTDPLLEARCDNSATIGNISPGCVFADVDPVFLLSGSAAPTSPLHAAFVTAAQNSLPGHPGRVDGTPLTRLADTTRANANRAVSCAGFVKNDATDSCDEYPYASTYQGGAGATVAHVPQTDNTNGGNKLSTFIRENRVRDNDSYFVQVVS